LAELRNQADSMCFQLEKLIKEQGDKIKPADKAPLEAAIAKTREVAKGSDVQAMKSAIAELEQASHAVSKTLYESGQAAGAGAGAAAAENGGAKPSGDEDAIDAEFEVKE
jgi:molecular chaperone DnaK